MFDFQKFEKLYFGEKDEFSQEEMFDLINKLKKVKIMTILDHDNLINYNGNKSILTNSICWRTSDYVVYRKGFEKDELFETENSIIYVEDREEYIFEIPNIKIPHDPSTKLRSASGLLVFNFHNLKYDAAKRKVSIRESFNAREDLRIVDVTRPHGWGLADKSGFPLRKYPSNFENPLARFFTANAADSFESGSNGYHGCALRYLCTDGSCIREISACQYWSNSYGVGVKKL